MSNLFNSIKVKKPIRSKFDLSSTHLLSMNMGELVPINVIDVVPGDSFNMSSQAMVRLAPMVAPVYARMNCFIHHWFVPYRVLWENWEKFITNNGGEGDLPLVPIITYSASSTFNRLVDYLGYPQFLGDTPPSIETSATAFALSAYQFIYNEIYRDQNQVDPVTYKLVDGLNTETDLFQLRIRAWAHDRLTSALPWTQKGSAVDLPLGEIKLSSTMDLNTPPYPHFEKDAHVPAANSPLEANEDAPYPLIVTAAESTPSDKLVYDPAGSLEVEPTTINTLRRAYALQRWLEKAARGGSRFKEWLWNIFGVMSPDSRLQRPEFICGSKSPIVVSEVLNTTGTDDAPQGNMSGHGIGIANGNSGTYYAKEHGIIISIMSVLPIASYQQGMPAMYRKYSDPTQYFTPDFEHIGEQAIANEEVKAFVNQADETFGYTPRYSEYKYQASRTSGDFKTSLDFWTLTRKFADDNLPVPLNKEFIECKPSHRIFAVTDETVQKLYVNCYNRVDAVRPMSKFSTPI